MTELDYPYHFDSRGRTAATDEDEHLRDLIESVLFTTPGERVNRPTFGSALLQLVFAPAGTEMATATEFLVQGALQQWLGDRVKVEGVGVESEDSTLTVTIEYRSRTNEQRQVAQFSRRLA
jgi:phage baseplate assembly protein W